MKNFISLISLIIIYSLILGNAAIAEDDAAGSNSKASEEYYTIGPNDLLYIFVWKEPELTQDAVVMLDGRIILPMIGEVMAKGRSPVELKNIITKKLQNYITSPEVTVIVKKSNSRHIYTIGNINKPGAYTLEPDMTVLQALSVAGGFTEVADTKFVMIVRRTGGKETMFRFNYQDFVEGKNLNQNILLKPGDSVVVR